MCAVLQGQAKRINDAAVTASSWHVLNHIRDWLGGERVDGLYDPEAVVEGGRLEVTKAMLVPCSTERLAVGTCNDQVHSCQGDDAGGVYECDILRY